MLTSLFTGVSGMNANGTSLSVISDNIANMNTIGFKSSRVSFGDVLSQSLGGASGSSQIGRGVLVRSVDPSFVQGSFETTANGLDLGLSVEWGTAEGVRHHEVLDHLRAVHPRQGPTAVVRG